MTELSKGRMIKPITQPVSGYELRESVGLFGVFVPEATLNMLPDASLTSIAMYQPARQSTIALHTGENSMSGRSLQIVGAGVWRPVNVLEGHHTFSAYVLVPAKCKIELYFLSSDGNRIIARNEVDSTGYWQGDQVFVTAYLEAGSYRIMVRLSISNQTWYLDWPQLEAKAYRTSFATGYRPPWWPGDYGYAWTGTPGTTTASRAWWSRAGGRLVRFNETGFKVTGFGGLGMPPVQHVTNPYAILNGTYHQRSRLRHRQFVIRGSFVTSDMTSLMQERLQLQRLFTALRSFEENSILLRYQLVDECGALVGPEFDIPCRYAGGLEGRIMSDFGEDLEISFVADEPFIWQPGETVTYATAIATTTDLTVFAAGNAPCPLIIEMVGTGRLKSIYNLTNDQYVELDHTLDGTTRLRLAPNVSSFPVRAGLYDLTFDSLVTDLSGAVEPGSHLPILELYGSSVPETPARNVLRFTFDASVAVNVAVTFRQRRTAPGVESALFDYLVSG